MSERQKRLVEPRTDTINGQRWVVAPEQRQPRRRKIVSRRPGRVEPRGVARQTIDDNGVPRGNRRWFLQTAGVGTLGLLVAHAAGLFGNRETETPTLPAPATAPPKPIHVKLPAPTFNTEATSNEEVQAEVDKFMAQFSQPKPENVNPESANSPIEQIDAVDIKEITFAPAQSPKIAFEASKNPITFSREESLAKQIKFVRQQPPILIPSKPASLVPEVTVVVATESQKHQASLFTAIAEANVNGIQNEAGWIAEHDPLSVSGIQRELERAVTTLAPVDTTGLVNSLALGHNSFPETDVAKAEAVWLEAQRNQQANFEHLTRQEQMLRITIEAAKAGQFQHLSDPNVVTTPEGTLIIPEDPTAISNSGPGGAGWLPGFPFFVFSIREATNTLVALAQSQIELQPFDYYDAAYRVKKANPLSSLVPSRLADAMYDSKVFKPIIKALGKLDFVEVEQFEGSMKGIGPIWQINRGGRFQVGQTFKIRSVAEIIRELLN